MKQETRYRYEQRIKFLEERLDKAESTLRAYRDLSMMIFDGIMEVMAEGKLLSQAWVIKQFKRVMR